MILKKPEDWCDLQDKVGKILEDCGFETLVEALIKTARGDVKVDVLSIDQTHKTEIRYLCECKYWDKNVSQTVIHAFNTVVNNYGGDIGFIVSKKGFQKGCFEAAKYTNIRLVTWEEFQDEFFERWFKSKVDELYRCCNSLGYYTEPLNSYLSKKIEKLDKKDQEMFLNTKKEYEPLSLIISKLNVDLNMLDKKPSDIEIPKLIKIDKNGNPIESNFNTYSEYFDILLIECIKGIKFFKKIVKD